MGCLAEAKVACVGLVGAGKARMDKGGSWGLVWIMRTDRQTARAGEGKSRRSRECARKHSTMHTALPCSQCQGIPQSTSLSCLHDRMIDLLYLQMNS